MRIRADRLTEQTAPTEYCVTLARAKDHLRIVHAGEDALIESYIAQATEVVEGELWRSLVTRTYDAAVECWPSDGRFELPRPPIASVTHIKYTDTDGNESTLSTDVYQLNTGGSYGWIGLKYNQVWPSANLAPGYPIEIRYVAGYGAANAVPRRFQAAVLLWTGVLYERREGVEFLQGGELAEILTLQRIRQMGRAW